MHEHNTVLGYCRKCCAYFGTSFRLGAEAHVSIHKRHFYARRVDRLLAIGRLAGALRAA